MSHCSPEAKLKPNRLSSRRKLLSNVFVAQVYWEAVPNTWPGSTATASVAKCVVCAWNSARSVSGRAEPTSWTFRNQVYVVSQVRRCLAGQRRVNETCQLEVDTSLGRKPLQLTQNWSDVVPSSSSSKALSTLSQKSETVSQKWDCRRIRRQSLFCDSVDRT